MNNMRKIFSVALSIAVCCSLVITSTNAATQIVSGGTKLNATSSLNSNIDYDIYGYIKYDYFGEDTSSSYDYVIDVVSLSSYVTNRGIELDGVGYSASCNSNNVDSTLIAYNAPSIASGASWAHTSFSIGTYHNDTMFRFNSDEFVAFSIGPLVTLGTMEEESVFIGWLHTIWSSSGRTTTWYGT